MQTRWAGSVTYILLLKFCPGQLFIVRQLLLFFNLLKESEIRFLSE